MAECPECGCEFESEDEPVRLNITDGADAILRRYKEGANLGDRLELEDAIRNCLVEKLGVSTGII